MQEITDIEHPTNKRVWKDDKPVYIIPAGESLKDLQTKDRIYEYIVSSNWFAINWNYEGDTRIITQYERIVIHRAWFLIGDQFLPHEIVVQHEMCIDPGKYPQNSGTCWGHYDAWNPNVSQRSIDDFNHLVDDSRRYNHSFEPKLELIEDKDDPAKYMLARGTWKKSFDKMDYFTTCFLD